MKLVLLLIMAALAAASPTPLANLNLNYLPPTQPFQPPAESYLPPPPSDSYLPPPLSRRSGTVEENLVDTGEPEEAAVEDTSVGVAVEAKVAEEPAAEAPEEAEAPVEEAAAMEEVVADVVEEVESGDQQPKFTPFYDDEEEQVEDGSLQVDQLHGVGGSYEVREQGEGYRNTDAREESKLYQNVEDVKTFNSEVHEYEYYPYESYGKEVTVVEPIIGKTYNFHAVPYQTLQPGYAPLRSVSYAPVQFPAYKYGPAYRPPPGHTREPSHAFPDDGTRYIARPPRPAGDGDAGGGSEAGGEKGVFLGTGGRHEPWPAYNAQAVFPASSGFPSAPIFAGSYSGESGYGSQWTESPEGEPEVATSGAEEEASGTSEAGDSIAEVVSSVSEAGEASSEASASSISAGEISSVDASVSGSANEGESSAEASANTDSDFETSVSSAAATRRSSSGQVPYANLYHGGYAAAPAWWSASPYPAATYQPVDRSDVHSFHPAHVAAALHQSPEPAASTTHQVYTAPPADYQLTPGLSRRRSIAGGPAQHAAVAAVPPVEHGLVYAAGSVVPLGAYGDGIGSRHVREGNIPGYYVRCVRHDDGPPSVSLVPFAERDD